MEHAPNLIASYGLKNCRSRFLRGLANTYEELGEEYEADYIALKRTLPMLKDYVIGMKAALKMRPTERDYELVEKHLVRYAIGKMILWEGSNTWYDNHCVFTVGPMMRKWGSLRLVSQEVDALS